MNFEHKLSQDGSLETKAVVFVGALPVENSCFRILGLKSDCPKLIKIKCVVVVEPYSAFFCRLV